MLHLQPIACMHVVRMYSCPTQYHLYSKCVCNPCPECSSVPHVKNSDIKLHQKSNFRLDHVDVRAKYRCHHYNKQCNHIHVLYTIAKNELQLRTCTYGTVSTDGKHHKCINYNFQKYIDQCISAYGTVSANAIW